MGSLQWKLSRNHSKKGSNQLSPQALEAFLSCIESHPSCFNIWTGNFFLFLERLYSPTILKSLCEIKMNSLKTLDLRNNEIASCEPLTYCNFDSLRTLDLSNNLIASFSPLTRMRPLYVCSIFNNPCYSTEYIGRLNHHELIRVPVNSLRPILDVKFSIAWISFVSKR